jgi:hypothetical protein
LRSSGNYRKPLDPRDAGIVWPELWSVLEPLLKAEVPDVLDVVIDVGYKEFTLVASVSELRPAVSTKRTVIVVPLSSLLRRVGAAFRRAAAAR